MDFLEYNDVACEMRGAMAAGRLKLTDEKIIFKATKSGRKEEIKSDEIDLVNWQRLAGTWGVRVFTKNGDLHRFTGFKEGEKERLAKFFKTTYKMDMLDRELSVKGWNWGSANFNGGVLGFEVGGSGDAFEIPLQYVNQCIPGKNEVTLEYHLNDDAAVMLSETRFHIPSSELAGDDPVESFKERVLSKASIVTTSGDAIAIFREIHCLSPRGRYDVTIYPTFISLHGKTFDYKIPHSTIMRLFLLPHKDQRQMHFTVNVDPPIKQGQTRYHFLVFNFKQEEEEDVELPFSEEELKEKYDGKLEKELKGPTFEIISKILKVLVNKKITVPGNFIGHTGTPAISCSYKAAQGSIYPLERGFIFIYKPPIFIRYDEVRHVTFERSGGSTRSFDISIATATSDIVYTFQSIEKGEYTKLWDYLKSKNINVKSTGKSTPGLGIDGTNIDHHLAHVQNSADELTSGSSSMSSDDEDFNPDDLEALSAKEEYDSSPSTTSSSGSDSESSSVSSSSAERRKMERERRKAERRRREKNDLASGDRPKRQKKTKLPGMPKRPMSAYMIWLQENRELIKQDNPGMTLGEIGKKAGALWNTLNDKVEWEEKAATEKARYQTEYQEWLDAGGKELLERAKKEAKAEKRAGKAAAASAAAASAPKAAAPKEAADGKIENPFAIKGGSGQNFKSKEFVDDDSSSDDEPKKEKEEPADD